MKNVVTIGGGGGHAQVLQALKALPDLAITAICPSTDSGGSTGMLIRDYGCLGYLGDLTKCIAALCPDEKLSAALMRRFEGGCLHGHSLKNLLLLGLSQTENASPDDALALMHRICNIDTHRVIPVSFERTELCAKLKFGGNVAGETNIDNLASNPLWSADIHAIRSIFLRPAIRASTQATRAIKRADYCIICPGDLYSSIVPVLLPRGVKQSFQKTDARIIVVLNIMTKRGETDGYRAEDFIRELEARTGRSCDAILYNSAPIPTHSLFRYRLERKIRLSTRKLRTDPRLVRISTLNVDANGRIYHDPRTIRAALQKTFDFLHPSET
jgi:uncharacterized cofD-like protein